MSDDKKKIRFLSSKIDYIKLLPEQAKFIHPAIHNPRYIPEYYFIESTLEPLPLVTRISNLSNCQDGRFHAWRYNKGSKHFGCNRCGVKFLSQSDKENAKLYDAFKLLSIQKLADNHCLMGKNSIIPLIQDKCASGKGKLSDNDLFKFYDQLKSIQQTENEKKSKKIEKIKEYYQDREKIEHKLYKMLKQESGDLKHRIEKLMKKLQSITGGNKSAVQSKNIKNFTQNVYKIDHDYLGNRMSSAIYIPESDKKIKVMENHPYYQTDVYYYVNESQKVTVFYNYYNRALLGYQDINKKDIPNPNTGNYLVIHRSLQDEIMNLGFVESNIYVKKHMEVCKHQNFTQEVTEEVIESVTEEIIISRIDNLKKVLGDINTILNKIK